MLTAGSQADSAEKDLKLCLVAAVCCAHGDASAEPSTERAPIESQNCAPSVAALGSPNDRSILARMTGRSPIFSPTSSL
jgi:hypothetical protein